MKSHESWGRYPKSEPAQILRTVVGFGGPGFESIATPDSPVWKRAKLWRLLPE